MRRRLFFPLAAAAMLAGAVVTTAARAEPTEAISDGVVRIGLILDLYGPYAELTGAGSATAARMAVEDFGGEVLGKPIEILIADHGDNTDRAAAIARDWFGSGKVDAVLDVAGSSEALIVQAIGHTHDRIVSISAAGAVRLTNEACTSTSIHYATDTYAASHILVPAIVSSGGKSWFFVTVDYSYGYDLENDAAALVRAGGGTVLGSARHPLDAPDFIPYLARARESHAQVIALANAGNDTLNAISAAAKINMIPGPQHLEALSLRINGIDDIGLMATQGMMIAAPFYWDLNDQTRTWSKRFFARVDKMPNELQAGLYSSVLHYLNAVKAAGTDATGPVMKAMRDTPIHDFFATDGQIRADGLMVHDMHLFQVKAPGESKYPWDYLRLVATISGAKAFQPLSQSKCPLVR
jgi:branched-chain amino acid transport system substrate-binding protein